MKFIKLESRGGNYLVVAENVAWLRSAENGQTNVGIVGGQPLLVVGTIEEVAAKILGETPPESEPADNLAPVPPASASRSEPKPQPAPEPVPAREALPPAAPPTAAQTAPLSAPAKARPDQKPAPEPVAPPPTTARPAQKAAEQPAIERPPQAARKPVTLSERIAAAAASPKVKAGSQRFMGMTE